MPTLYAAAFLPAFFSARFTNVDKDGLYSTSAMELAVKFGGMVVVFLIVAYAYGTIMKRYFVLRLKSAEK